MKRNIELFLKQGVVMAQANVANAQFGEIRIKNPNKTGDPDPIIAYTHPEHSFEQPGAGPDVNSKVYFFLVPGVYIFPEEALPKQDAFIAVNVSLKYPYLRLRPGTNAANRHPCGTTLTIQPDAVKSRIHYIINDFGELFLLHTKKDFQFSPWKKLVLDYQDTDSKSIKLAKTLAKYSIACCPKLKKGKKPEYRLLKINLNLPSVEAYEDTKWEWGFESASAKS